MSSVVQNAVTTKINFPWMIGMSMKISMLLTIKDKSGERSFKH